jgi:hypothetical protein
MPACSLISTLFQSQNKIVIPFPAKMKQLAYVFSLYPTKISRQNVWHRIWSLSPHHTFFWFLSELCLNAVPCTCYPSAQPHDSALFPFSLCFRCSLTFCPIQSETYSFHAARFTGMNHCSWPWILLKEGISQGDWERTAESITENTELFVMFCYYKF